MDFMTSLLLSANWTDNSYNLILDIVNCLTKIVHHEPVTVTIDTSEPAEAIIDMVVQHYGLLDSIISDRGPIFTSKFWSSLRYFLGIK